MISITSYCFLTNEELSINGQTVYVNYDEPTDVFLKAIYKNMELVYPKFYKMDLLSKAAFIVVEALKSANPHIAKYADDEIALFFSNKHSSADTDYKFLDSYENGSSPGPALFVYTLPNILIGELAIRNKWYGENLCTVTPHFDASFFADYTKILLARNAKACLCGWVNVFDETEVFLFFAEQSGSGEINIPLTAETLKFLYKK